MRYLAGILFLLFLAITAIGQDMDDESFVLRGVDHSKSLFLLPAGVATECINFDLGQTEGVANKRDGYSYISDMEGTVAGIFAFTKRNGQKRLFISRDELNYQTLYYSNPNSYNAKLNLGYSYGYRESVPFWLVYNEILIYTDGKTPPLRYNGTNVDLLVEPPPGHWAISVENPYLSTTNVLNGDYYYFLQAGMPDSIAGDSIFYPHADSMNCQLFGYRVHADSDWVLIYRWQEVTGTVNAPEPDSTIIRFGRTRAGGSIDDSVFQILVHRMINGNPPAITRVFRDVIPDDSLGFVEYWDGGTAYDDTTDCTGPCDSTRTPYPFMGFRDTVQHTADTANDSLQKLGQIAWEGTDVTIKFWDGGVSYWDTTDCTGDCDSVTGRGGWRGISKYLDEASSWAWKATHYFVLLYDSSTGMVSDSGPSVRIPVANRGADTTQDTIYDYGNRMRLSPITQNETHLARLIVRGIETVTTRLVPDTSKYWYVYPATCHLDRYPECQCEIAPGTPYPGRFGEGVTEYAGGLIDWVKQNTGEKIWEDGVYKCRLRRFTAYDTIATYTTIGPFRVIDTIWSSTDSTYIDSLSWADFTANKPVVDFSIGWVQKAMNFPVEMNDVLYMAGRDNRVYYSGWGKPGYWPPENNIAVSIDDGQEITGLRVVDGDLYVLRTQSIYKIRQIGLNRHSLSEYVSGIGCIAPHSIANGPNGGLIFLSELGVQSLTTSLTSKYKETGQNRFVISQEIQKDLDAYDMDDLRKCHTWTTPDKNNMYFGFHTLDSSKVLALNGSGWSTSTFAFKQTTNYNTDYQTDLRPTSDVLGILNESDSIFKFGGVKTDAGDSVQGIWKSGAMFRRPYTGRIEAFALWKESDESAPIEVEMHGKMAELGSVDTTLYYDSTQYYFRKYTCVPDPALWFDVEIRSWADSLVFFAIDLWWNKSDDATKHEGIQ